MTGRLPAKLEATAIMRRVEGGGDFATIIKRGDADSGSLVLLVAERGVMKAVVERRMAADFAYRWSVTATEITLAGGKLRELIDDRTRFDPDCWLIELDVADAERFVAETTASP